MSEERLTYRAAGVDVEANNEANERIRSQVRRTHGEAVLTRPGLFGGALSLREFRCELAALRLIGTLGYESRAPEPGAAGTFPRGGASGAARARALLGECRAKLPSSARPLAFLDYLAAEHLHPLQAEALVCGFADALLGATTPKGGVGTGPGSAAGSGPASGAPGRAAGVIPLIGGETAEMPSTFARGAWEVVGALFALDPGTPAGLEAAGPSRPGAALSGLAGSAHPALVFTMDGVGTKTRLAVQARRTEGLALDIIHHSVNDILCQGAEGIGLLFYVGCHRGEPAVLDPLLESAGRACASLGIVLLEAAVAEKPELYLPGEYDVCACLAGAVDAAALIQGAEIREGDLLVGLGSSGLHTNGYSLARRALLERGRLRLSEAVPELGSTLADALLAPHKNYAPSLLPLLRDPDLAGAVRGLAHITGGGLPDNLARILPPGLGAEVRLTSWEPPGLFRLIQRCGSIPDLDSEAKGMYESFNMGIGMVLAVDTGRAGIVRSRLEAAGEQPVEIGKVTALAPGPAGATGPGQTRVRLIR